jgi:hypothetical protein
MDRCKARCEVRDVQRSPRLWGSVRGSRRLGTDGLQRVGTLSLDDCSHPHDLEAAERKTTDTSDKQQEHVSTSL